MFALIDCNNFYASCEELFEPKIKNHPVVVLSNNDGCIITRNKKAKEMTSKKYTTDFKEILKVKI